MCMPAALCTELHLNVRLVQMLPSFTYNVVWQSVPLHPGSFCNMFPAMAQYTAEIS